MSEEIPAEFELEIAHVLFIDAVGYSTLSINEQRELFDELNRIVRTTPQFQASAAKGKLIRLPTGDGMALVFSENPQAPAQCALEVARQVKNKPHLPLRMGIHSGPVSRVVDVNDRANVAGAGINIAQRVMDCGDRGHILLSKHAAEDLAEHRNWRPYLHDIGECELKHGTRMGLVNLYTDDLGNPRLPARMSEDGNVQYRRIRQIRRTILIAGVTVIVTAAALVLSWNRYPHRLGHQKSIAVLPFTNLGTDAKDAAIADGMHDEILTDLSKVADLKVVSRTSVMQYRGVERNLREIAKQLGVANILEGSVQFAGDRVKVTAQLIDARSDTHIWADKYETNRGDVFGLESEVAKKIVAQLQSRLSAGEKAAIEERPTADLVAYDLYARAKNLIDQMTVSPQREVLFKAVELLEQAVARDPSFALAYYQLAHAHDQIYSRGFDRNSKRLALAETAIQSLQHLRPDSGEAHLALAKHLYWGYLDYDHARQELLLARRGLPNDPLSYLLLGYIDRRQGRWEESIRNMEYALELDPRNPQNVFILQQLAKSYECERNYPQTTTTLERALAIAPRDPITRVQLAQVQFDWRANTKPLHSTLGDVIAEQPGAAAIFARDWLFLAMCEHDLAAADRALAALTPEGCHQEAVPFPRAWCEGQVELMRGNSEGAQRAFATARDELDQLVKAQPNNGPAVCALGLLHAMLGNKKDALEEGRRAIELLPVDKDSINGALLRQYLALVCSRAGETDSAIEELSKAAKLPSYLSYGQLQLDPLWDPLRGDSRFQKIVASLAPKN